MLPRRRRNAPPQFTGLAVSCSGRVDGNFFESPTANTIGVSVFALRSRVVPRNERSVPHVVLRLTGEEEGGSNIAIGFTSVGLRIALLADEEITKGGRAKEFIH